MSTWLVHRATFLYEDSQSDVPGPASITRNLLEMHIFSPVPTVANGKLWGCGPAMCVWINPTYDSHGCTSVRTSRPSALHSAAAVITGGLVPVPTWFPFSPANSAFLCLISSLITHQHSDITGPRQQPISHTTQGDSRHRSDTLPPGAQAWYELQLYHLWAAGPQHVTRVLYPTTSSLGYRKWYLSHEAVRVIKGENEQGLSTRRYSINGASDDDHFHTTRVSAALHCTHTLWPVTHHPHNPNSTARLGLESHYTIS